MNVKNVLYCKQNDGEIHQKDSNISDIWDDSILIKAYDKAISLAKEEVAKRLSVNTNRTNQHGSQKYRLENSKKKEWMVGSPCRAVYPLDGGVYEAIIIKIFHDINKCLVKFVGYGNVEKVELSSLYTSNNMKNCLAQQETSASSTDIPKQANTYKRNVNNDIMKENTKYDNIFPDYGSVTSNLSFSPDFKIPTVPPLPSHMLTQFPIDNSEALASMLMSWYISGFHTGYYHGIEQQSHEKRKKMK